VLSAADDAAAKCRASYQAYLDSLTSTDPTVRIAVARVMAEVKYPGTFSILNDLLIDDNIDVRAAAAEARQAVLAHAPSILARARAVFAPAPSPR